MAQGANGYGTPSSLRAGDNAADRRVLMILAATTVPQAAPDKADSGRAGFHSQGKRWLHLWGKTTGTTPSVTVDLYFWDSAADDWFASGLAATLTPTSPVADFEIRGKERVAFVASARANPNNTLDLWASVNDVPADL